MINIGKIKQDLDTLYNNLQPYDPSKYGYTKVLMGIKNDKTIFSTDNEDYELKNTLEFTLTDKNTSDYSKYRLIIKYMLKSTDNTWKSELKSDIFLFYSIGQTSLSYTRETQETNYYPLYIDTGIKSKDATKSITKLRINTYLKWYNVVKYIPPPPGGEWNPFNPGGGNIPPPPGVPSTAYCYIDFVIISFYR